MTKSLLLAAALAASPALAHEHSEHAKKGEHQDAPASFEKQPPAGTWARCPVSGEIFRVGPGTEFSTWQGRVYAFCCDDCKPDFDKSPAKYTEKK